MPFSNRQAVSHGRRLARRRRGVNAEEFALHMLEAKEFVEVSWAWAAVPLASHEKDRLYFARSFF